MQRPVRTRTAAVVPAKAGASPKRHLVELISETLSHRRLSQVEAAALCGTDQPTLSKVLRGRTNSVTLDKLCSWLNALGRSVEIRISDVHEGHGDLRVQGIGPNSMITPKGRLNFPLGPNPPPPIYLDHHATTPVDPRVAEVVLHAMTKVFGNPNSADHLFGDQAAELLSVAKKEVATLVGAEVEDVHFTSGATQSVRLALAQSLKFRTDQRAQLRVIASEVEHRAVLDALKLGERMGDLTVHWIDVDRKGRLNMDTLARAVEPGVDLICLMAANNEVGTLYPIERVARIASDVGASLLVDATQAAGRVPLAVRAWGVTYLTLSAHKMYGPKGVGALILNADGSLDDAEIHDGTPNVPGIAGLGEACRLRRLEMETDNRRIAGLRDELEARLLQTIPGLVVNGDLNARLSENLHVSIPDVPNDAVLARLRRRLAISTGAACSSGVDTPSHVLRAMGLSEGEQEGALRISLGRTTTSNDIAQAAELIRNAVSAVRCALGRELLI